jgi:hypothetical protein
MEMPNVYIMAIILLQCFIQILNHIGIETFSSRNVLLTRHLLLRLCFAIRVLFKVFMVLVVQL